MDASPLVQSHCVRFFFYSKERERLRALKPCAQLVPEPVKHHVRLFCSSGLLPSLPAALGECGARLNIIIKASGISQKKRQRLI